MEHELLDTVQEILAGPHFARRVPVLDELTGAYTTRTGVLRLDEEVERALRYRHSLACFIVEIDALAAVRQTHGQGRADCILQDVGSILRHTVRASDVVCRLDPDRFLLITPRQDAQAAQALAERIRLRITRHRFPVPGSAALSLTASVGVAAIGTAPAGAAALVQRALASLEAARAAGGNRVALG